MSMIEMNGVENINRNNGNGIIHHTQFVHVEDMDGDTYHGIELEHFLILIFFVFLQVLFKETIT